MSMNGKKIAKRKVIEILNKEACCGEVRKIYDLMCLGHNSYVVIFSADGPWYGAFIVQGHVEESGGTGNANCRELIADRLIHNGEFIW